MSPFTSGPPGRGWSSVAALALAVAGASCDLGGASQGPSSIAGDPEPRTLPADQDSGQTDDVTGSDPVPSDPAAGDADVGDPGVDSDGPPLPSSRGWSFVRSQPMLIAGLFVVLGPPPGEWVDDYFDGFGANALHLWETGLPDELASFTQHRAGARWLSWTQADGTSRANGLLAGGLGAAHPGRIGYQVSDEPRTAEDVAAIGAGVTALRAHDPEALLVVNFMGKSGALGELAGASVDLDVFSYDDYDRGNDSYRSLAAFRALGLAHDKPYWRYLNAYRGADQEDVHSESDQRWDAFSGLVFGYTGHTWFLYQVAESHDLFPIVFAANNSYTTAKTGAWTMLATINRELENLGRAVTQLVSTDVRFVPALDFLLPEGVARWQPGAGDDPFITGIGGAPGELLLELLVGFFRDARGARYVMIQNVRHNHGDWPSNNDDAATIRVSFDFSAAPATTSRAQLETLDASDGLVKTLPLAGSGELRSLEVRLAAGDPVLFKYDDGRPFALGP